MDGRKLFAGFLIFFSMLCVIWSGHDFVVRPNGLDAACIVIHLVNILMNVSVLAEKPAT